MCLPELLLRKGSWSNFVLVRENTVNSDFMKQHSQLLCMSRSVYFFVSFFSLHASMFYSSVLVSVQVAGPPTTGAFRERPSKPTAFRKFYERGEFPVALGHDTKGNRITWKVRALHTVKGCLMVLLFTQY